MDHMHVSGISLSSVNLRWRLFDPERGRWAANFVGTDEYFLPSLVRSVHLFPPLPKSEYLFSTAKKKRIPELWNLSGKTLTRPSDLLREPKSFSLSIKKHYSELGHVRHKL